MPPPLTAPPDLDFATPRLACPTGAIDCHVHVFGFQSRFPFHPDSRYLSKDRLPETQIALQDSLGVSRTVPKHASLLDFLLDWAPEEASRTAILAEIQRRFFSREGG